MELSIFTYHYVRPLAGSAYPGIMGVEVADFVEHLRYLGSHYQMISMEDLLACLDGDEELPARAALLTFDDGYRDHFDYVFPLLQEYGWQGAFFVPMQAVFEGKVLDVNKIHFVLASAPAREVTAGLIRLMAEMRDEYDLAADSEYLERYAVAGRFDGPEVKFVKNMLQYGLLKAVRERILDRLFDEFVARSEEEFARELYVNQAELARMEQAGMHIGSHGYAHVRLSELSDEEQKEDVQVSAQYLRQQGVSDTEWTFCYPYGEYNEVTISLLRDLGCQVAFTTKGEVTDLAKQDRYELKRLDANDLTEEIHKYDRAQVGGLV